MTVTTPEAWPAMLAVGLRRPEGGGADMGRAVPARASTAPRLGTEDCPVGGPESRDRHLCWPSSTDTPRSLCADQAPETTRSLCQDAEAAGPRNTRIQWSGDSL